MEGQGSPSCVMTPAYLVCEPHRRVQYSWPCPRAHIGGLDPLSGVQQARHVVVDGLVNSLPLLKRLHVLVHELKVLCLGAQRSDVQRLAAIAVLCMVVVEADDGGHVADQRVAVRVATCMSSGFQEFRRPNKMPDATMGLIVAAIYVDGGSGHSHDRSSELPHTPHLRGAWGCLRRCQSCGA